MGGQTRRTKVCVKRGVQVGSGCLSSVCLSVCLWPCLLSLLSLFLPLPTLVLSRHPPDHPTLAWTAGGRACRLDEACQHQQHLDQPSPESSPPQPPCPRRRLSNDSLSISTWQHVGKHHGKPHRPTRWAGFSQPSPFPVHIAATAVLPRWGHGAVDSKKPRHQQA